MRRPRNDRFAGIMGLVASALLLTACVPSTPDGEEAGSPSPSTAIPTQAPPSPTSASPVPDSSPTSEADSEDELRDYLIQRCADEGDVGVGARSTVEVSFDEAILERREMDPEWFVHIPFSDSDPSLATSEFGVSCLWDRDGDEFVTRTALVTYAVSEEELELRLTTNDWWGL